MLRRAKLYRRALTTCLVDPLLKDERNRTDGSGDMPVQSFASPLNALVDCSNPADSCAKTMTWRDVGDSLATQNFDADSVVIAPKLQIRPKSPKCPHHRHATTISSTVPVPSSSPTATPIFMLTR